MTSKQFDMLITGAIGAFCLVAAVFALIASQIISAVACVLIAAIWAWWTWLIFKESDDE